MTIRIVIPLCLCIFLLLTSSIAVADAAKPPVKIIFDTDMDSDCDDVGALAMLHALADQGEAEILATICSTQSLGTAQCIDAINTWFNRPNLPIGAPKGKAVSQQSKYASQIAAEYPHDLKPDQVPDAMQVYRDVLSKQPDQSVVIVTVGDLTNIANLLKQPAADGQLSGVNLVRSKVKQWVCMGGNFIGRPAKDDMKLGNNNFSLDKSSSFYAVRNWPIELTFVGREIGSVPSGLKAGARLKELPEKNIVRRAYALYFGGEPKDRHLADQTTVLFAVRGLRDYWDIERSGTMDLQPNMTFTWRPGGKQNHLLKRTVNDKPNDREIEKVIETLMMSEPKGK